MSINNGSSSVLLPAASALVVTFEKGNGVGSAISQPEASQAIPQQPGYIHLLFEQEQQSVLLFLLSPSVLSLSRRKSHTRAKSLKERANQAIRA